MKILQDAELVIFHVGNARVKELKIVLTVIQNLIIQRIQHYPQQIFHVLERNMLSIPPIIKLTIKQRKRNGGGLLS